MCGKALEYELENNNIQVILDGGSFGFCEDLSEIEKLVSLFNIPLIVDIATTFGEMINKIKK